jgi:hypothetical protein
MNDSFFEVCKVAFFVTIAVVAWLVGLWLLVA